MEDNMKLHDIFKTSIINTIRFNLYYFGLRRIFRPPVLISKNVSLHALKGNVVVNNSQIGAIRLGYGSVGIIDGKKERFIWENAGNVIFDNRAVLNIGTRVCCMKGGTIKFGRNFVCNGRSSFICAKSISFGDDCLISWDCLFMDTDFHKILDMDTGEQLNTVGSLCVGNHVWIGCRCLILKGANIPNDSVIAAGSKCTKSLCKSNSVYVDNSIIKENVNWKM